MIVNVLKTFLATTKFKALWIAYSGGLDSHVLLHALTSLRNDFPLNLKAIYINHGLSPNAHHWEQHCRQICHDLNVDFITQTINAQPQNGDSPENAARTNRYAVLTKLIAPNDALLTAHHQDDQAETLLIQLLRGAGPKGLAAMPKLKSLGKAFHARPLLDFNRETLQQYAEANNLKWIEDESNTNLKFSRNFMRHKVMPLLKERWPTAAATLSRVSTHCAEAQYMIDTQAKEDFATVKTHRPYQISVTKLSALSEERQSQVLRFWFKKINFPVPNTLRLKQIQQDFLQAFTDKTPHIVWRGVELRRFRDELYAMQCLQPHNAEAIFAWDFKQSLIIPGLGSLQAVMTAGAGLYIENVAEVTVRFRQGGEICQLPGRTCHHSLKKLFQTWNVPPWERDRLPLIFVGERLVAVLGYFIAEDVIAAPHQPGYLLNLSHVHATAGTAAGATAVRTSTEVFN